MPIETALSGLRISWATAAARFPTVASRSPRAISASSA